jgi:hypothetical protein
LPAFTFEKLSAPTEGGPAKPPVEQQRSTLGQLLHRFSEARVMRSLRRDRSSESPESKSTK